MHRFAAVLFTAQSTLSPPFMRTNRAKAAKKMKVTMILHLIQSQIGKKKGPRVEGLH